MTEWQLTIDCIDPSRLVGFWSNSLGYEIQPPPDGFVTWNEWYQSVGVPDDELDLAGDGSDRLLDPTGRGPKIWFQPVPEAKIGKNRLHLDIFVGGGRTTPIDQRRQRVDSRAAELIDIGATIDHAADPAGESDRYYVVMRDPQGNEFCVA
jgi:hypothetical protein